MKALGIIVLIAATAAGLWGVGAALHDGHAAMNTTQHVPWGLWVALYIFFLGLSAGSFLLSTLVYVFGVRRFEAAGPPALLQALGCLLLGGFLIIMDLGHPERAYKVLTSMNPTSVMGWMGIFYLVYVTVVSAELFLALRRRPSDARRLRLLGILGIPVAIVVTGGVGAIFAVAKARPGWFSGLFPIVFLISALVSGGALLTFLTAAFTPRKTLALDLALLTFGLECFALLLLASEILVTLYGNVPHESLSWKLTLFGPYAWVFWGVQLGAGFAAPLLLLSTPRLRSRAAVLAAVGLLIALGILGERLNLVIPAQFTPVFAGLPDAYLHARWLPGYFPSLTEWLVGLAAFAAGAWAWIAARRLLPLEEPA